MHTKNPKQHFHPTRGGMGVEGLGEWKLDKQALYNFLGIFPSECRLIFDLFLNFYEFVLCSWIWVNTETTQSGMRMRKLNPGDSLKGSNRSNTTLNHKYFPCQQLISLWFICKCEICFLCLYFYLLYIRTTNPTAAQKWLRMSLSTLHPSPCFCTPLSFNSLPPSLFVWRCERVFFYFYSTTHPFSPTVWVILLNFVQYFHLASFAFSLFFLFALSIRFSTIFFLEQNTQ